MCAAEATTAVVCATALVWFVFVFNCLFLLFW